MSIVELRQKSLHFDLSPAECETPHLKAMLFDRLKTMYEHTCMDSSYVLKIMRIIGEPAPRTWNPRKMDGEMQTSVLFEYQAEVMIAQSEVKTQTILHGGRIIRILEHQGELLVMCTFGNHTTGTITLDMHGVVNVGMIVPVRASHVEYPQNTVNNVTILGELLKPRHFNPRYLFVAAGSEADVVAARKKLGDLDIEIAQISLLKRAQYFKAWIFPYNEVPARKSITLSSLLSKRSTKAMYVRLDDACDIANLEFLPVSKMPLVDSISLSDFATCMIDDARRVWGDIATFSETYAEEDMFTEHKTIWNYYESMKFADVPEMPAAKKSAKQIPTAESVSETPTATSAATPASSPKAAATPKS